ncbi:hypothetical protein ACFX13_010502 [Malus domestica]
MHVQLLQAKNHHLASDIISTHPRLLQQVFLLFIVCNLETRQRAHFQQHPSSQTKFPHFLLPQDHLITCESHSSTCCKTPVTLETKHHQEKCCFEYLEDILEVFHHKLATTWSSTCSTVDPCLLNRI